MENEGKKQMSWKRLSYPVKMISSPCIVSEHKRVESYAYARLLSRCLQWATLRHSAPYDATSQSNMHVTSEQPCYPSVTI